MTLLDALRKTELMWLWLAQNPTKSKEHYPQALIDPPLNLCYCCSYVERLKGDAFDAGCSDPYSEHDEELLALCPLRNFWPTGCQGIGSSYLDWQHGDTTTRTIAATQIATAAHNEILRICQIQLAT